MEVVFMNSAASSNKTVSATKVGDALHYNNTTDVINNTTDIVQHIQFNRYNTT